MNTIVFFDLNSGEEQEVKKYFPQAEMTEAALTEDNVRAFSEATVLCGMVHSDFSREILEQLPKVRMIALRSVGYNHVDLTYCHENNIIVTHVPDYGSYAIAEHVFALLLSSIRNIEAAEHAVESGIFDEKGLCGETLKDKTIGIIGTGKIGTHVCRIASLGFEMNVLAYDIHPNQDLATQYDFEYVDIDTLYQKSDIISLHVPLFPSTEHLINKESLAKMKQGIILVNTSRGKLICTEDLVGALHSGKIKKALLDVLENEQNLDKDRELVYLPQVIVTPHIAYYTHETVENMYKGASECIQQFLDNNEVQNKVQGY